MNIGKKDNFLSITNIFIDFAAETIVTKQFTVCNSLYVTIYLAFNFFMINNDMTVKQNKMKHFSSTL